MNTPPLPFLGLGDASSVQALADLMPDGVFTTDVEGRVTSWNPAATRITGWSRDEALGRDCSILAGDALRGCSCGAGPLRCGLVERGRASKSCTIRTRDGRLVAIAKSAVALLAPDGTPIGTLESFTEVGEQAPDAGPPVCGAEVVAGPDDASFYGLVGRDPSMRDLFHTIDLVARSESTVMILGESGSGKERVAEAIHLRSRRSGGPFVRVACSALNENLLESELFGHVRGAFTGAVRDRRGRFEEADGGTLLLDEIGDVSPAVQVKLLRAIEAREVERVGDSQPIRVDVRLLCATHRDLKALVQAGRFRADLYFRLAVFPIRVPPLRERGADLELVAARFLDKLRGPGRSREGITGEALAALRAYSWPGNVRELQNVLEFAALRAGDGPIAPGHLPAEVTEAGGGAEHVAAARRATLTRDAVLGALERARWNRTRAARVLGVSRVTLWKRIRELGLSPPRA